jgi:hypothetical protein
VLLPVSEKPIPAPKKPTAIIKLSPKIMPLLPPPFDIQLFNTDSWKTVTGNGSSSQAELAHEAHEQSIPI